MGISLTDWPLDALQGRKTFDDWEKFFVALSPEGVSAVCAEAMSQALPVPESLNFYAAGIKRLRDLAHLSIALSDDQRAVTEKLSDLILAYVEERFAQSTEALQRLRDALDYSKEFYRVWGHQYVRQWLYDRGVYDEYGVQLADIPLEGPPATISES
jgi:hypothetical protein